MLASRRCAAPPYGAGAVRPRAVAPPPLAAVWARGRCQEPPWPRPCPRLRAEAAAEPAKRPWLPGAVGVGPRCSLSLPFCRSPFPAARSGAPGGESEERRRDPGGMNRPHRGAPGSRGLGTMEVKSKVSAGHLRAAAAPGREGAGPAWPCPAGASGRRVCVEEGGEGMAGAADSPAAGGTGVRGRCAAPVALEP